jgi:exopolysaccharide production protein ExoQ
MTALDSRRFRLGFATFVLFTGIAGDFWRNSFSWYGYGVFVVVIAAISIVVLIHNRARFRIASLPYPLLAFIALAFLSIAWSYYPGFTVLGAVVLLLTTASAVSIAVTVTWPDLLIVLGWVFRLVLGLSFLFEFIVSAIIRHPIYPVWITPESHPAKLLYWSRDLLFDLGKIQGIVGNSSLLAMAALIGLIVFAIQLASKTVKRGSGWFWLAVAIGTIGLTRSATVVVALTVVIVVALAALLVRRARTPRGRAYAYGGIVCAVALISVLAVAQQGRILALLGKSSDFTGRFTIWNEVIQLAQQRPGQGWGWLGYWIVWIAPFNTLKKAGGVQPPHAHDAWLDVWLQLGILGLVVFGALVLATLIRSWLIAIDPVVISPRDQGSHLWLSLLPLLVLTAQLVQSIAESRILLEGGLMLLVIWAVKTKTSPLGLEPVEPQLSPATLRRRP